MYDSLYAALDSFGSRAPTASFVDLAVDRTGGCIGRGETGDHDAVVGAALDQVGYAHVGERAALRVDPEGGGVDGVTDGAVPWVLAMRVGIIG